jgi:O-antigen/teichoic acid export membrane protein
VFLVFGSSNSLNLKRLILYKISFAEVKKIVAPNWAFIIIGSVFIVYWRMGNLIISKMLSLGDVANYEVSYRVFSLALILPLIISTTVFPSLVELHKNGDRQKFNNYFHKVFVLYLLYSLLTYTFFYSFSDFLIPFAFGEKYIGNAVYTKQMFLTVLVCPTALLQANVLVALHKEKSDMWLNILSLVVNVAFCFIGLYFYRSLSVVNYAVFTSFFVFHICQDVLLAKFGIVKVKDIIGFYLLAGAAVGGYVLLSNYLNPVFLYLAFWTSAGIAVLVLLYKSSAFKRLTGLSELKFQKTL